jgi:hypothetical protein
MHGTMEQGKIGLTPSITEHDTIGRFGKKASKATKDGRLGDAGYLSIVR